MEYMELGELDLEGIEKACENLKEGYIPFQQLVLFKEANQRGPWARSSLGIHEGRGRKTQGKKNKCSKNPRCRRKINGFRTISND